MDYINDSEVGVLVPNEPIVVGSGDIYLKHHNDKDNTLNLTIFTGLNQSLTQISDYTVHSDPARPWRKYITFGQSVIDAYGNQTVYLNYTSTGDYVDDLLIKEIDNKIEAIPTGGGGSGLAVQVLSVSPLPDSTNVEVNAPILATINKWLDDNQEAYMKAYPTALDRTNDTNSIGTVERYSNKTLRLTHVGNNFDFTSLVYVRIFAGLTAVDGMQLENNYDFSFQTASAPPNDDPIITLLQTKVGSISKAGYTIQYNYTNTNPEPGETVTVKLYEKRIGTDLDFIYKGDIVGSLVSGNYEFAQTGTYNYGQQVQYKIGLVDGYNAEVLSSPITVNMPINQSPAPTPTIVASINSGGNITFRITNSPISDTESDSMTATVFVDGVAYIGEAGYNNATFTGTTWSTNTVLNTNFADGTTHTIKIEIYDGYNTVSSNTVTGLLVQANQPPTASAVSISGGTTVGSTQTGNYTVTDAESDTLGTHIFRWLRDSVTITGATNSTRSVVELDVGKPIVFGITPKATTGTLTGTEVLSAPVTIPVPAPPSLNAPAVGNQQVTNTWTPNATLSTETYNLLWKAGSAPTQGSYDGKLTNVTSGVIHQYLNQTGQANGSGTKLTNDTVTYYYGLEMVVNGVPSVLSAIVSGIPTTNLTLTFDGTAGSAIDANLTVMKTANGSAQINGSGQLESYTPAVSDGVAIYRTTPPTLTDTKTYKARVQAPNSPGFPDQGSYIIMTVFNNMATKLAPTAVASYKPTIMQATFVNVSGTLYLNILKRDNANSTWDWDITGSAWSTTATRLSVAFNTYYWVYLETTATLWRFTIKDATDTSILLQIPWQTWSTTIAVSSPQLVVASDPYTDYWSGKVLLDTYAEI